MRITFDYTASNGRVKNIVIEAATDSRETVYIVYADGGLVKLTNSLLSLFNYVIENYGFDCFEEVKDNFR